jgi:uncharacterized protein (DUF1800 family)
MRLYQNRLGFGPTVDGAADYRDPGQWLAEQLRPPPREDAGVASRLSAIKLHIKYDAKDDIPATDELRGLTFLPQPLEAVWPLTEGKVPGQERERGRRELVAATLARAVYSPWQLQEILADFWHNHFNVDATDQTVSLALPTYDREVIRPHLLGNFREMLEAVATSTAMLVYLDNRSSRAGAANENYGRELFELHTLGAPHYLNALYDDWKAVPGAAKGQPAGYIDEDVYESARAFTGWTIEDGAGLGGGRNLPKTGKFTYVEAWHDGYQKRVLANDFNPFAAPLADGRKVLDLVAYHPGTAQYVCTKLCRRLVSDNPPPSLVQKAAAAWTAHAKRPDQIAQVVRVIATSLEFTETPPQKIKRPLELVASFVRGLGIDFTPTDGLLGLMEQSGQRLYAWAPPTGHPDVNEYWIGTNSLRIRWALLYNLALNQAQCGQYDPGPHFAGCNRQMAVERMLDMLAGLGGNTLYGNQLLQALKWPPNAPLPEEGKDHQDSLRKLAAFAAMTPAFQVR